MLGGLEQQGNYDAQQFNQYLPQGSDQARQDAYNATYGQITKDVGDQKARDQAALSQSLADRGIPVGSEQYNDQMKQFNTRYDNIESDARQKATLAGNDAFQQSFNMGQQNYQNRLGAYQSNYSMPASIAGQLNGLQQIQRPDLIGFTPVEQQGVNLQGMYDTATGAKLKNRELNIAQQAAGRSGGGGGGASSGGGSGGGGFVPDVRGVVGGPQAQQPRQPSAGQVILEAGVQGLATGYGNSLARKAKANPNASTMGKRVAAKAPRMVAR